MSDSENLDIPTKSRSIKELFPSLSNNGKKLLISMVHPAEIGVTKTIIIAFSGVEEPEIDETIDELKRFGLWEQGRVEKGAFIQGEGERHRLPNTIKQQVMKDILNLPER